jgi:hypothetical protein
MEGEQGGIHLVWIQVHLRASYRARQLLDAVGRTRFVSSWAKYFAW